MLGVAVTFFGLIGVSLSLDAVITLHCDNKFIAKASYDNGNSYTQIASGEHWPTAEQFTVPNVTPNTIVDVECTDVGVVGGFIATVAYDGNQYYTDNPITNSIWQVVSSSDNNLSPLVYEVKNAEPWNINTAAINDNAYWVWNDQINNIMVFRFDFGDICSDSFIGATCGSDNDCPQCLKCCEGRGTCHERTNTYSGEYIVPSRGGGPNPQCGSVYQTVCASTYKDGEQYCTGRYGTVLPTLVDDVDVQNFIATMQAADENNSGWSRTYIGLNDRSVEGNFVWADGTPCKVNGGTCVDYWQPGEPNLNGNNIEDCVWFWWDTSELSYDSSCHQSLALACNKPHPFIDNGHDAGLAAMAAANAKVDNLHNNFVNDFNDDTSGVISNKYTNNYNGYYNIMVGGFILFILINNVFLCYWCVCKENYKRFYQDVKVEFNEE